MSSHELQSKGRFQLEVGRTAKNTGKWLLYAFGAVSLSLGVAGVGELATTGNSTDAARLVEGGMTSGAVGLMLGSFLIIEGDMIEDRGQQKLEQAVLATASGTGAYRQTGPDTLE